MAYPLAWLDSRLDVRAARAARIATLTLAVTACADDETSSPAAPPGPPQIAILTVAGTGGGSVEIANGETPCVAVGDDPGAALAVEVSVTNWTLRAPGGCRGEVQCGFWNLTITSEDAAEPATHLISAGPTATVSLSKLPTRTGLHTLRVELRNDDGTPVKDVPAATYSVTIDLQPRCGDVTDAGTSDAALDAATDSASGDSGHGDAATADSGTPDAAGTSDAGATDAGTSDAAAADARPVDATAPDAATADASVTDASVTDARMTDAPAPDTGSPLPDAAGPVDATSG